MLEFPIHQLIHEPISRKLSRIIYNPMNMYCWDTTLKVMCKKWCRVDGMQGMWVLAHNPVISL